MYTPPMVLCVPLRMSYAGGKSRLELETPLSGDLRPLLGDAEFTRERDELARLLNCHAVTHP